MHIKKLILLLFLIPVLAQAQKTTGPNYTYIAQRYEWLAGVFKALGIPAGDSAQFQTGQELRAGAVYYDSVGVDSGLYVWSGLAWRNYDPATLTASQGITKIGSDFQLGGTLGSETQLFSNRFINMGSKSINFHRGPALSDTSDRPSYFNISATDSLVSQNQSLPDVVSNFTRTIRVIGPYYTDYINGFRMALTYQGADSVPIDTKGGDFGGGVVNELRLEPLATHPGRTVFTGGLVGSNLNPQEAPFGGLSQLVVKGQSGSRSYLRNYFAGHTSLVVMDSGQPDTLENFIHYAGRGYTPAPSKVLRSFFIRPTSLVGDSIWFLYDNENYKSYLTGSVAIGGTTGTATASSLLDVTSTTKGVIWPRMTTTQKNAIASPATGLIVFDTDLNQYNFYNGAAWAAMGAAVTNINDIGDATGAGFINVGNNSQQWSFAGLTGSGLLIESSTTAATSFTNKLFRVLNSGANASSDVTTQAVEISNSHSGTNSTNIGLVASAINGTNNHAIVVGANNGNVGFGTETPNSTAILELSDTARGFLPSRMTAAQRTAIGSPASALFLWDNDSTRYMGYNGTSWKGIAWTGEGGAGGGTWGSITGTLSDQTDLQAALDAKANTSLSNLASTAINTSLISDANNTDDLGSTSLAWKDIYSYTSKLKGSTSGEITLQATATAGTNTITFPAATGTVPLTNQSNSWSLLNTFSGGIVANTFQTSVTSTNSNLLVGNAVGGTASTLSEYLFGTAAAVGMRVGIRGSSALTTAANASYANLLIGDNVFQEAGSGTHWGMGDLVIAGSTVTNGAGSTDYLFGAYIEGPPTGITPNVASYGLWVNSGRSRFGGTIQMNGYTVATLPAGVQGDIAYVTDATAPTYLATIVGGGAVVTPVFFDGTNWVAH